MIVAQITRSPAYFGERCEPVNTASVKVIVSPWQASPVQFMVVCFWFMTGFLGDDYGSAAKPGGGIVRPVNQVRIVSLGDAIAADVKREAIGGADEELGRNGSAAVAARATPANRADELKGSKAKSSPLEWVPGIYFDIEEAGLAHRDSPTGSAT